jgi:diaminopimelate epimerase
MAVDDSNQGDFRLHFYNSDGSRGEMCGNGARCICRFAYDLGIAGPEMVVETDAGLVHGWRLSENQYRVKLNNPGILDLNRKPGIAYVELGNPGVPHAVAPYSGDLWKDKESLRSRMETLRHDPAFPKGANVNFYQVLQPGEVRMLTFERGVEDFTLACGTGSGSTDVQSAARRGTYRPQPGRHPDPDGSGPGGSDSGSLPGRPHGSGEAVPRSITIRARFEERIPASQKLTEFAAVGGK